MNTKKRIYIGLFVVLVLVSFFTVRLFVQQGQFQSVVAQSDYQCQPLKAPFGPEDLVADYDNGWLYISASTRFSKLNSGNGFDGGIYKLNMNGADTKITKALLEVDGSIKPAGMSLIRLENGERKLFVIDQFGKNRVRLLNLLDDGMLKETDNIITNVPDGLNSIVAIDKNRFYATQNEPISGITGFINIILGLKNSKIIYYDGQKANIVADGLAFANGIEMSSDGNVVYVTDTLERTLNMYKRDKASNALSKTGDLYLGAGGDNIRRHSDGSFLIAGHPKMFSSIFHIMGWQNFAPSVVFKAIPPQNGKAGELRVVHLEQGEKLSASSAAVQYKHKMFVGTVVENRILYCTQ